MTYSASDSLARAELAPAPHDTSRWPSKRREFLRILGAGAGLAALGPLAACGDGGGGGGGGFAFAQTPPTKADQLRAQLLQDTGFWNQVEAMFTLDPAKVFMNIGTAGSMPKEVLDYFDNENRKVARDSGNGYGNFLDQRKAMAPGFGVDPDELVISYNTSAGMCVAILGIPWERGDVVVTTNHEHGGGLVPLQIAIDRYGIEASYIKLPIGNNQTAADYANLFEQRIQQLKGQGKRVRAMMWSAPTYKTGTMLPIADLMEVVKRHGLISIVDGAHLPGMMAYTYADLGMDFMSGAGHKWQCGPGSTGILIVRNKVRASNPTPLPPYWPILTSSYPPTPPSGVKWTNRATGGTATYDIASVLQGTGSMNGPMFRSLAKACEVWDRIGRKKIETYDLTLASYLKEKIAERWGVDRLYSPKDDPKLLSGLTSFNPFANAADVTNSQKSSQFVARMLSDYAPAFVIRNVNCPMDVPGSGVPDHWIVRISTHLWHDAADIDRLVDSMWDLSRKMA